MAVVQRSISQRKFGASDCLAAWWVCSLLVFACSGPDAGSDGPASASTGTGAASPTPSASQASGVPSMAATTSAPVASVPTPPTGVVSSAPPSVATSDPPDSPEIAPVSGAPEASAAPDPEPAPSATMSDPSDAPPVTEEPTGASVDELSLSVVEGNGTLGLEWPEIAGATGYNVYWSQTAGAGVTGEAIPGATRGYVHRGLDNGVPYYYVVTALLPDGESAASAEVSGTPGGEWVLEHLGTGDYVDVTTGGRVPTVPVAQRQHVLLLPEGYTEADLAQFHSHESHGTGDNDVDAWMDEVFAIEPYSEFREAFVVWYLPRASNTQIGGGDTAFGIPLQIGGSLPSVTGIADSTAVELWAALERHPYPPEDATGVGGIGNVVHHTAAFLIFDPSVGRAYGSGLSTGLPNPNDNRQRIGAAFAMGHAHEFTHAFTGLADEYIETTSGLPRQESETSNVVGTNVCSELPWAHLLAGSEINPDVEQLVGAFGTPEQGYHPELLCLLNGTHDNGEFYASEGSSCQASSCTLRVEDRMCNFCREMTAFNIYARAGGLDPGQGAFDEWKSEYRDAYFQQFGFATPDMVPQSNDVRRPENGATIYEACVP